MVDYNNEYLYSRDLQERIEELENQKDLSNDEKEELKDLNSLKNECEDYGWEYGINFIRDYEFEDYAIEMFDECYAHDIPDNLKNYIDYKAFSRDLEMDYIEIEFRGNTYLFREA